MATFTGDNHTGARTTKPKVQYPKGELGGQVKVLIDRKTLVDAAGTASLDANDEIDFGFIPANSLILDAKAKINKSLGATGIFDLGYRASTDGDDATLAEDPNALVDALDAGGQAAVKRADVDNVGLYQRVNSETQIFATCTEVCDDSVLDAVLTIEVQYTNE